MITVLFNIDTSGDWWGKETIQSLIATSTHVLPQYGGKRTLQNLLMEKSGKTEIPEGVLHNSALGFLRYGEKRSTVPPKDYVMLMVLTGYISECPIMGFQT